MLFFFVRDDEDCYGITREKTGQISQISVMFMEIRGEHDSKPKGFPGLAPQKVS